MSNLGPYYGPVDRAVVEVLDGKAKWRTRKRGRKVVEVTATRMTVGVKGANNMVLHDSPPHSNRTADVPIQEWYASSFILSIMPQLEKVCSTV